MDYQQILIILQSYWGIIACGLGFSIYTIFHWQNAKKIILSVMLQLEKEAETLAISTGDDKFEFLVDKGYQMLPQTARVFITPAMFTNLAQSLYDQAKTYLVKYVPETPVPETPVPVQVEADSQTS